MCYSCEDVLTQVQSKQGDYTVLTTAATANLHCHLSAQL